jgi:monoamine oxidase
VNGENVYVNSLGVRTTYSDTGPTGTAPPDPLIIPDLATVVTRLDQMAAEIDVDHPWNSPDAVARDSQTFQSWLEDNSVTPQFRDIAAVATRPIFGAEPRELSLLYVLFYIAASGNEKNVGTFERNFNTRDGAQMFRFVGGTQLICNRMAKRLGRRVVKRAPVQRIHQHRGGVTVTARGITVEAERVVVAIPPALAARIECTPALPVARDSLTQRVSQGTLMKAAAVYDKPFWRDDGLNGAAVSYEGPLQVTYDGSPPDGSPGVLFGFIGGDHARSFRTMSRAKRRAAVLANLTKYFGPKAAMPRKYFESDWPGEVFSRGGPVGYTAPGALTEYGPALRRPVGRIHWAGTETSGYWVGYMDGAIRSGERVAAEVLKKL